MHGLGQLPGPELPTSQDGSSLQRCEMSSRSARLNARQTCGTTIGRFIWKRLVGVMLSLQVIVMLALGRNVFVAKEALVVILLVAISMAVILLLVVASF